MNNQTQITQDELKLKTIYESDEDEKSFVSEVNALLVSDLVSGSQTSSTPKFEKSGEKDAMSGYQTPKHNFNFDKVNVLQENSKLKN